MFTSVSSTASTTPDAFYPSPDASPTSVPDGRQTYFSPATTSARLDSIQELGENHVSSGGSGRPREQSLSSLTFQYPIQHVNRPKLQSHGKHHRKERIRTSSPPAPPRFQHHVSFDNFAGGEPTERNTISFTLNVKHKGYTFKRRSRTFMVGLDENSYSNYALEWMLAEMVDDGDEIVCLRVVDKDAKINSEKSMGKKEYQEEARLLMKAIQAKNDDNRAISIVLEFAVGKVHTTFQKMVGHPHIQLYEPAMLIVGTRGRSLGGFQGLVSNRNSFSKWCLQYSPIPVVVVRPDEKRLKKKLKRSNDPTRQSYLQILQGSGQETHEAVSLTALNLKDGDIMPQNTPEMEAHEVAAALALPAQFDPTRKVQLTRKMFDRSDVSHTSGSVSPESRPSSPLAVPKSSKSTQLESPAVSEGESESDEVEFEALPGHTLLGEEEETAVEMQKRLHDMEVGEAAALAAGRKASVGSIDSVGSEPAGAGQGENGKRNG